MKNWTVGKRITLGFAAILALVATLAAISFVLLKHSSDIAKALATDPLPGALAMSELNGKVADAHIAYLRGFTVQKLEDFKRVTDDLAAIKEKTTKGLADYDATIRQADDRANFQELKANRAAYIEARDKVLALLQSGKKDEALALNGTVVAPAFNAYMATVDKMEKWNFALATKYGNDSASSVTLASRTTSFLSVLVLVVGVLFAITITFNLNRTLRQVAGVLHDGATQVVSAASQISSSSQSLAEGASEQAASLEETSSSLEELDSMTKRNSESSRKANDLAKQSRQAADKGVADMQAMSVAMDAIKASSNDIAKIIKTLNST